MIIYKGTAYRGDCNPTQTLLTVFEECMTSKYQAPFRVSRKTAQYGMSLIEAERILDLTEGDQELAAETIRLLFAHKDFAWKTYTRLMQVRLDAEVGVILARKIRAERERKSIKAEQTFNEVMNKEDIF